MIRRLTAVAALMFVTSAAFAGTAIDTANNQIRVSAVHQKFDYKEVDAYGMTPDGVLDSERGNQNGAAIGFSIQRDIGSVRNVYFNAEYTRLTGDTDYDGYLQGGETLIPYQSSSKYTTTDIQVKVGQGFQFGAANEAQVTPYVSFGSYKWLRDSSADQYGYAERYKHQFAGIGALVQYEVTPRVIVKADYMYGKTHSASMTLVADDTKFTLQNKPIQQLTLGADYIVTKNVNVHAEYRISKFQYGESETIGDYLEPTSKTKRDQLFVGVGYTF